MLPVTVDLDINIVAMVPSVHVTALHSSTNSQVLWQIDNVYIIRATHTEGVILRPIINDYIIIAAALNISNSSENCLGFIVGGYNNQNFQIPSHLTLLAVLFTT